MLIVYLLFLAVLVTYAGFSTAMQARRRAECEQRGHRWTPAGLGDHPDADYVCDHCYTEFP